MSKTDLLIFVVETKKISKKKEVKNKRRRIHSQTDKIYIQYLLENTEFKDKVDFIFLSGKSHYKKHTQIEKLIASKLKEHRSEYQDSYKIICCIDDDNTALLKNPDDHNIMKSFLRLCEANKYYPCIFNKDIESVFFNKKVPDIEKNKMFNYLRNNPQYMSDLSRFKIQNPVSNGSSNILLLLTVIQNNSDYCFEKLSLSIRIPKNINADINRI